MPRGRQLAPLTLDEETGEQLASLTQLTTLPHSSESRPSMPGPQVYVNSHTKTPAAGQGVFYLGPSYSL